MTDSVQVKNDTVRMEFTVELNGERASVVYGFYKGDIAFLHSHVPESFRGQGIGSALAIAALEFARTENKKIMLYCPFLSRYVRDHAEYHDLVDLAYHPTFFDKLRNN